MNLKASAKVKISTFLEKMGGWGCGSQNGPLLNIGSLKSLVLWNAYALKC